METAQLKTSLCAFLDVLGFSERVLSSYREGQEQLLLADVQRILTTATMHLRDLQARHRMFTVRFFTDNLVIGYEVWTDGALHEFMCLCELVADYQLEMSCRGLFVRGGIALGTLAVSDAMVFGDALIRAYELETRCASYPRVIVHPELKIAVERALWVSSETVQNTWRQRLLVDADGYAYVNYLSEAYRPTACKRRVLELDTQLLRNHRSHIVTNLRDSAGDMRRWVKWFWVANYHNAFCRTSAANGHQVGEELLRIEPRKIEAASEGPGETQRRGPNPHDE